MYKLVIADDEAYIRRCLRTLFDWKRVGFEVVADFEDGRDVLAYVGAHPVDVVLTDIRMYEMDGLELARALNRQYPALYVVMLSGHKDFEYARQAVDAHAYGYLLKPVDIRAMQAMFTELADALARRAASAENWRCAITTLRCPAADALPSPPEEMLDNYLSGEAPSVVWRRHQREGGLLAVSAVTTGDVRALEDFERRLRQFTEDVRATFHVAVSVERVERYDSIHQVLDSLSKNRDETDADEAADRLSELARRQVVSHDPAQQADVERVKAYLDAHLADKVTLEGAAAQVFLSPAHLSRLFKAVEGENFIDYLIRARMEKAKELLARNDLSTYEVARLVGYPDIKYFYRAFKKYAGHTVRDHQTNPSE